MRYQVQCGCGASAIFDNGGDQYTEGKTQAAFETWNRTHAGCSQPRLHAAAPDLLAALKALRGDSWRHTVDWGPREEREAIEAVADAAIAKAEGTAQVSGERKQ